MILEVLSDYIYYYSEDITVVLEQCRFSSSICTHVNCYREGQYIWGMLVEKDIYDPDGWDTLIDLKFREYGMKNELEHEERIFKLSLNCLTYPKEMTFRITSLDEQYSCISYNIQGSCVYKACCVCCPMVNTFSLRDIVVSIFTETYKFYHVDS